MRRWCPHAMYPAWTRNEQAAYHPARHTHRSQLLKWDWVCNRPAQPTEGSDANGPGW